MKNLFMIALTFLGWEVTAQTPEKNRSEIPEGKKQEWIKENPEKYKEMGGQTEVKDLEKSDVKTDVSSSQLKVEIPPFPVMEDTGNPKTDAENFERRKSDWYAKVAAIHEYNRTYMQSSDEKEKWIEKNSSQYITK